MLIILLFVLILNIVAIALTYHSLSNFEKKERIICVAVGIAIIYIITSIIYWISTKNVASKDVAETAKNVITFLFVPINAILTLPIIAKSYCKYKMGKLAGDKLRNRIIVLAIPFIIVLIIECSYFTDIQNGILEFVKDNTKNTNSINSTIENSNVSNDITNVINSTDENIMNETGINSEISNVAE